MRMKMTKKDLIVFGAGILITLLVVGLSGAKSDTDLEKCEHERDSCNQELDQCIATQR